VRFLFASILSLGLLALFLPVLCMSGEDEAGSCQSLASIQLPGSAEDGDLWQVPVLVAAVLVFVLVMRLGRSSRKG
jgi:hypothetical protein